MSAQNSDRPMPVAVLISGGGTTLKNLIAKIAEGTLRIDIRLVLSSTAKARGIAYAEAAGIPVEVVDWNAIDDVRKFNEALFEKCRNAGVELVVCGGFLKQLIIPDDFANRVINIHPALIPSFCGKGYYGRRVHAAAIDYGVKLSGCTIHYVDNEFDHGPVVLQRAVPVEPDDTPESLAARVFEAECEAYPEALQLIADGRVTIDGRCVRVERR
ncbi:MAG: phosphoribosylglycinamide formyltransferase [Planctomycetia bacterium]